ncbi:MAG: hypothetical protein PHI53_00340 [Candidatus Pacebacteria bacterium]|nr:hypothetical protein [Candidatus Paceibacterota bacterium]
MLINILKRLFIPDFAFFQDIQDITKENLELMKRRRGIRNYNEWLKNKRACLEAIKKEREKKSLKIPESYSEKINLLEEEIKETGWF